jgi:hypothetical protein
MKNNNLRYFILIVLVTFAPMLLAAEDTRTIPLDMYLIIDGSAALENSKNDILLWINEQIIDRILTEGDKITVWSAGNPARIIFSDTVSGAEGKNSIKDKLIALEAEGQSADFTGALVDAASRIAQTRAGGLPYTLLITASAGALVPAMSGSQSLLRWFRSERYERWQVLVVAPDIGRKVQQAAAAYMSSLR